MQRRTLLTLALLGVVLVACVALSAAEPKKSAAPSTPKSAPRTDGPSSAYRRGQKGQTKDANDRHHAKNGKFQKETATNSAGRKFDRRTGQFKRVEEDPALFRVRKVTVPADALAAIHLKPASVPDVRPLNWKAPRRSYRLRELARKANSEANTTVVAKTGSRKQKDTTRPQPNKRGGTPPRPTGARPKFNPKSKANKNVLAFGRGPAVKYNNAPVEGLPEEGETKKSKAKAKDAKSKDSKTKDSKTKDSKTKDSKTKDSKKGSAPEKKSPKVSVPSAAAAGSEKKTGGSSKSTGKSPQNVKRGALRTLIELPDAALLDVSADSSETPAPKLVKPVIDASVVPLPEEPQPVKAEAPPCPKEAQAQAQQPALLEVDADAGADSIVVVNEATHSLVEADVVGEAIAPGDVKLPSGLVVTAEQIQKMTAIFATQKEPRVFYHWGDYMASIRWGRNRKVDRGEIEWLNTQNEGMAAGGGYYLAQDPMGSYGYGPVPCYIFTKAGALVMDNNQTPIKTVLGKTLANPDKAVLGQYIPFIHSYNTQNGWWVTHHPDILSDIRCGNAVITPDPLGKSPVLNPVVNVDTYAEVRAAGLPPNSRFVTVHFDKLNGQVVTARPVDSQFQAHQYLETMISDRWDDEAVGNDVRNAAKWVRSFWILMSYIDGLSLVRAKTVFPSDPWQAFEPNRFGPFHDAFNAYVQRRMKGETIGIAKNGVFGSGTGLQADAWATKMVDDVLPRLYRELSAGSELKYRTGTVRAGGPVGQDPANKWTTGSFVATKGQVAVMQQNPYLSVESSEYPAGGDPNLVLSNYYYPDPLRIKGVVVSTALKAQITAAANYTGASGPADLARDTPLLMRELLVNYFKSIYGKPACSVSNQNDFAGALKAALALVSIHPCSDFNGRSTRFFMLVAALEGCGTIPVSFMSDFDIVTQFDKYNAFMVNSQQGYLQLKVAMLAELISSLANNKMAQQYQLPEWGTFLATALKGFGQKQFSYQLSDEENEMVRTRQFVPIIDRWFGKAWPGRNAA